MADGPAIADASGRWPAARAWAWYERLPWLMGCNFLPSSAVNFLAMWYGPGFDAATIARELGWAAAAGFNTVRTNLAFAVWEHDRDGLMARIECFLHIAAGHGLATMFCLFDDCGFGGQEPVYGPQAAPVPGLHNSRAVASPGRAVVMDMRRRGALEAYVSDIIAHFADDDRILAWDLYNEPGNRHVFEAGSERQDDEALEASALTLMGEAFAWARRLQPLQPLTVAAWRLPAGGVPPPVYRHPIDRAALALSDVISFHGYCRREVMAAVIADLMRLGRPLLCTEWMARPLGSRIDDQLALFAEKRVGAWQWGLVKGLSQTHIPWPALMEASRDYDANGDEWFHDLLREDGEPWSRREMQIIATIVRQARG
jgi:hypothetical protein